MKCGQEFNCIIKKTIQAASIVANLLHYDKSDPDENAQLAKTDELVAWLSRIPTTEGNRGTDHRSASGLIRHLRMLIETSRADSGAIRSSSEVYIRSVQDKIGNGNPDSRSKSFSSPSSDSTKSNSDDTNDVSPKKSITSTIR